MQLRRPQLTYANVVSSLALFVALGGTSYAVARNSVGSAQLRSNAVTSAKVKNRSLRAIDLAPAARIGQRGPRGATGPAGEFIGKPEEWKPLALAASWAPFAGDHQQPGYRKDRQGLVHLRGLLSYEAAAGPPSEAAMATLPPGYRPTTRAIFAAATGQGIAFTRVYVDPNGTVQRTSAVDVADRDYTSLNGITFWTD
jgi:hypothetical protein